MLEQIAEIAGYVREAKEERRRKEAETKDRLLNTAQAAELLNVSTRTLQRYRSEGALSYKTLGKKTYYSETDVLDFLSKHVKDFRQNDIEFYKARIRNMFNK